MALGVPSSIAATDEGVAVLAVVAQIEPRRHKVTLARALRDMET
jgi:hypothetical protein